MSSGLPEFLRKDGFSLETPFRWGLLVAQQESRWAPARQMLTARRAGRALSTLPLNRADVAAIGRRVDYIQDMLVHDPDAPRWEGIDHRHRLPEVTVPVSSFAGWYDICAAHQTATLRL
jgi:predicted acyl esterase